MVSCAVSSSCGFGDAGMIDQRALHFHRADAMARYIDDVVHSPEQPEIAVGVAFRPVACHVDAEPHLFDAGAHRDRSPSDAAQH